LPIVIINTAHVVSMDNYTSCATSAAGSLLLVMVGNGRWCVGGVGGDFSHTEIHGIRRLWMDTGLDG